MKYPLFWQSTSRASVIPNGSDYAMLAQRSENGASALHVPFLLCKVRAAYFLSHSTVNANMGFADSQTPYFQRVLLFNGTSAAFIVSSLFLL